MLSESRLSALALCSSVLGLLLLAFFSAAENPVPLRIEELGGFHGKALLKARIVSSSFSGNTLFLTLFDGNSLRAVYFNPSKEALGISARNSLVMAEGFAEENARGRSFIVSRLEILND